MSMFMYLADTIMGTNVSGMNGDQTNGIQVPPGVRAVSEYDFNRANEALMAIGPLEQEVHNKSLENENLKRELEKLRAKYESSSNELDESNKALASTQRAFEHKARVLDAVYEKVGSEDQKLSAKSRAEYFVRAQYKALAKRFGYSEDVSNTVLHKELDLKQRFTFNVYIIAAADYMMLQSYLASIVAAMEDLIDDAKKVEESPFFNNKEFISKIQDLRQALISDLIEVSRIDSDTFKKFHKERVQVVGKNARFLPGGVDIDPQTVPPLSAGAVDDILSQFNAISAVKSKIADSDIKKALDNSCDEHLIPSAYQTSQFSVKGWTV